MITRRRFVESGVATLAALAVLAPFIERLSAAETFESGIEKTVDWYLANEDWWRPIREGTYRGERLGISR